MLTIRMVRSDDAGALWRIFKPILRAGETYPLPRALNRAKALAYWCTDQHQVFVAEEGSNVIGSYYLRANQRGGGSHVANCGYLTAVEAFSQGAGRAMCAHSLAQAKSRGFRAMQFNFVVSTNERAVRLWRHFGFGIVGRLPEAFLHPNTGYVDAYVMYRML